MINYKEFTNKNLQRIIDCPIYALEVLKDAVLQMQALGVKLDMSDWVIDDPNQYGDNGPFRYQVSEKAYRDNACFFLQPREHLHDNIYPDDHVVDRSFCSACAAGSVLMSIVLYGENCIDGLDPDFLSKVMGIYDSYRAGNKLKFFIHYEYTFFSRNILPIEKINMFHFDTKEHQHEEILNQIEQNLSVLRSNHDLASAYDNWGK